MLRARAVPRPRLAAAPAQILSPGQSSHGKHASWVGSAARGRICINESRPGLAIRSDDLSQSPRGWPSLPEHDGPNPEAACILEGGVCPLLAAGEPAKQEEARLSGQSAAT